MLQTGQLGSVMTQTTGVEAATTAGKLRRGPIIAGTYHRSAGSVLERLRDPASARATGIRAVVGLMVPGQWTAVFRDDTDSRGGGCNYSWRLECQNMW